MIQIPNDKSRNWKWKKTSYVAGVAAEQGAFFALAQVPDAHRRVATATRQEVVRRAGKIHVLDDAGMAGEGEGRGDGLVSRAVDSVHVPEA